MMRWGLVATILSPTVDVLRFDSTWTLAHTVFTSTSMIQTLKFTTS